MAVSEYEAFLASKKPRVAQVGIDIREEDLNPYLFPLQRAAVVWALRRGRAALFQECGLGKSLQQLEWGWQIHTATGGDVLILAPLAVAQQTKREGEKFGIPVTVCRSQADVRPGINVTNYEMLEHFNAGHFVGMVADESSILKNYMGKTKMQLVEAFRDTPYKLCCTATPAPNDHMEIGNHAEFLGIMPANEMLSRWFINDTMSMGTYRLKGHAKADFWQWVASWALSARRPSDLGYDDDGYILPPLTLEQVTVDVDLTEQSGEMLFRLPSMNATSVHKEMRLTAADRAQTVAEMVNGSSEAWIVWCNTNYEADELVVRIPDAVEVRGSETLEAKERKLEAFTTGRARVIISKPSICGFGLNWQHCHNVAFVGLSYSFEQTYQAMRRSYRFGQENPVHVRLIVAETEGRLLDVIRAKMAAHEEMLDRMAEATTIVRQREDLTLSRYEPRITMTVPYWLSSAA